MKKKEFIIVGGGRGKTVFIQEQIDKVLRDRKTVFVYDPEKETPGAETKGI